MTATARPCVFLDRDGTITREAGYINHPDRLELLPGAASAVRRLNRAGVLAVLTTNQAGLARGYFDETVMQATMDRLVELLAKRGARLDAIYCSPFHPSSKDPRWAHDPDEMRKPGGGMIRKACRDLPIDMARSYVVGDRSGDILFAHSAGIKGIMVMSGYGLGEYTFQREGWTKHPDFVADDLGGAVSWVLNDLRENAKKAKRKMTGERPARAPRASRPSLAQSAKRKQKSVDVTPENSPILSFDPARPASLPAAPAERIVSRADAARFARECQDSNQRVVFANGCFDIMHGGHVSYLNDARAEGDVLIVGVNSDASERAIKGEGRPVMPGLERAELLAAMEAVDRVVIFEEPTAEACLREIRPDVHAKGTDYSAETVPEREIAAELGIRVAITGAPKQNASKLIMRQIREGESA